MCPDTACTKTLFAKARLGRLLDLRGIIQVTLAIHHGLCSRFMWEPTWFLNNVISTNGNYRCSAKHTERSPPWYAPGHQHFNRRHVNVALGLTFPLLTMFQSACVEHPHDLNITLARA